MQRLTIPPKVPDGDLFVRIGTQNPAFVHIRSRFEQRLG
jgi:hypothetical protein